MTMLDQHSVCVLVDQPDEPEGGFEPTTFTFADVNPLLRARGNNGVRYMESLFDELPWWAQQVLYTLDISPSRWNVMVVADATSSPAALAVLDDVFCLGGEAWFLELQIRAAAGHPPEGVCSDCWGTGIADDDDGSVTGMVGQPFLCFCIKDANTYVSSGL